MKGMIKIEEKNCKSSMNEPLLGEVIDPLYHVKPGETIDPLYHVKLGEAIDVLHFVPHSERKGIEVLEFIQHIQKDESIYEYSRLKTSADFAQDKMPKIERRDDSYLKKQRLTNGSSILSQSVKIKETEQKEGAVLANVEKLDIIRAEESSATNFTVHPVCRHVFINRKGEEVFDKSIVDCLVYINQIPSRMTIKTKEISSLAKIITQKCPNAILDFEERQAGKMVEIKFRNAMRYCPVETVYFEAAWQQIGNRQIYLRDGINIGDGIRIETDMTLPAFFCNADMLLDIFRRAVDIYSNPAVMAVIFNFSLMGVLYRLFMEAGFPPHFTLFMFGRTGSMKTTISKIFFVQLCEEKFRNQVRRIDADTTVSLERAVVSTGRDTVTLIDDFSPAKTKAKKREMEDKLEMIIRMVGDGSSRSRSNIKLEDHRGEGVQGMVALTGELRGKGISSNLRCLYAKIEREYVNEKEVSWFQENPEAFTTLIAAFVDFLSENYIGIVSMIQRNFKEERKKLTGVLRERRLIDSAVTLRIAADIFEGFLTACCQMPIKEAQIVIEQMKIGILECTRVSHELSSEESPGITFIRTVAALMRMNQIVLNSDKIKMSEASEYDGFEDDSFLYFNPYIIHKKVVAFLHQTNCFFPYEKDEVLEMLVDDRIIKTASNGLGKRTLCVRVPVGNGKKQNFMKIRKTIFESICEGNYDCEKGER